MRFFSFLLISLMCAVPIAGGQEILSRFDKPLPEIEFFPQSDFEALTRLREATPLDDASLAHGVRLPADWVSVQSKGAGTFTVNDFVLGDVVHYQSPPGIDAPSWFKMQVLAMDSPIAASHWFLDYVGKRGYTLEGIKVHNDSRVEAIVVVLEQDETYVVRNIAQRSGNRMILSQMAVPTSQWQSFRTLQAQSMNSLKFKNIDSVSFLGEKHSFFDIAHFEYPKEWTLKASSPKSVDRMEAKLTHIGGGRRLEGAIDIALVSRLEAPDLKAEILSLRASMLESGFSYGPFIERQKEYSFHENVNFAVVDVYRAQGEQDNLLAHELWFTILSAGDYYYFITMLTPARDGDFTLWSSNIADYRRIVESVTPLEESFSK